MKLLAFFLLAGGLPLLAQTNPPSAPAAGGLVTYSTNQVEAHADFRRVNGQLYNTARSYLWTEGLYTFIGRTNGLVYANRIKVEEVYEIRPGRSDALVARGNFIGSAPGQIDNGPRKVRTGETKTPDGIVAITNLMGEYFPGDEFTARTMVTGRIPNEEMRVNLLDVGTPNIVPVITTNTPMTNGRLPSVAKEPTKRGN
jgi:hypothetical protein